MITIRHYLDATLAVAIMAGLGIIAGFAAGAISGDRILVAATTLSVFALTGVVLIVRLWRLTRKPEPDPGT